MDQLKECEGIHTLMAGRLRVTTTFSMFMKSHLHISHGLTNRHLRVNPSHSLAELVTLLVQCDQ